MAVSATVVRAWMDASFAYLAVRVSNDRVRQGTPVAVEYVGKVSVDQLAGLTGAQQKATLVSAVQAERARSLALQTSAETDIAAITGTVQV